MEGDNKKTVRGIKIRNVNVCMMLVSCFLYAILILVTIHASRRYDIMISAMEDYIGCERNADLVKEGSDYLTEQVRLYVVTMNPECMDAYFDEVYNSRRRDTALEQMKSFQVEEDAYHYLEIALEHSNKLMEKEIYAMKLVAVALNEDESALPQDVRSMVLEEEDSRLASQEMIDRAREIVFSAYYQEEKENIMNNISFFLDTIVDNTLQNQRESVINLDRTMTEQRILISVLFVENILIFFLIMLLVIKPLKIYIENIEGKEKLNISGSYEFKYLALTYNNIYELNAENEATLHYRAEHDALTGIMNRGAFDSLRQIMKKSLEPIALLIIDVDKFKQVNDGYGHEVGDKVLKKVAKMLQDGFRSTDYAARIGGDEFAVILTDVKQDMSPAIQQKIKSINDMLLHPEDGLPQVSLSVGGAFSTNGFDEDLYKRADAALYEVKENGRCGCGFYEEKVQEEK